MLRHLTLRQRSLLLPLLLLAGWILACPSMSLAAPQQQQTLTDLPLPAQAAIAAALGKDQTAYHARSQGTGFSFENSRHALTAMFLLFSFGTLGLRGCCWRQNRRPSVREGTTVATERQRDETSSPAILHSQSHMKMGLAGVLAMLVLIVGMLLPIDPVHAATISIEPHRTFLLTNNDSSAGPSIPIELMSLGLSSGNFIQLERLGDFRPGVSYSDTSTKMIGVFSASSTLLGSSTLHRVQDAIDAGEGLVTPSTFFGGYSTDIPQDFEISNTIIQIPAGATHLFVAAWDQLYGDNTDPDGDYAVRITAFNPTVYLNDFESVGSESAGLSASGTLFTVSGFSSPTLTRISLPTDSAGLGSANQSMWLGRLGHNVAKSSTTPETVTLDLSGLVPGSLYSVAFDLLIGDSWDGSAGYYGPDRWSLTVQSGAATTTLLDATFSNCGVSNQLCGAWSPQTYSDATPLGGVSGPTFAPTTGADAAFDTNQDYSQDYAIYWFGHGAGNPVLTFTASASTASLQFQRLPHAGGGDNPWEYWALDNVSVTAATTNIAGNTDYDAFVDFSSASNPTPDGLWRYGFTPSGAAGPLTLYTHHDSSLGLSSWRDTTDPNVTKNETGSDLWISGILFPATEFLALHPGPSGERSVVRWTAPVAGAYQIAADFRGLRNDGCGQTVDVHVLHNGTELYVDNISGGSDVSSFLGTRIVGLGDTVDFQVGKGPDTYACDSTGLKAIITLDPQTLTVTKVGTGTGTVTSAPTGITCGATCAASFGSGTEVTLTATPDAGSAFAGWSGDPDCSDGSVTMNAAKACTANFAITDYILTVDADGTGSGTVGGGGVYDYGTVVTLTATSATGSTFTGWGAEGSDPDCVDGSVTMNASKSCTATFTLNTHTLTVNTAGTGAGTVSGGGVYEYGTAVTLTASPSGGSVFVRWMGHCNSLGQVTLDVDKSCTAIFMLTTPAVTWARYYGGTGYETAASIQQTTDGGYIVAGETDSFGAGGANVWLLKLDAGGAVEWQKEYTESYGQHASSIQQTTDGGYIVAGRTAYGNHDAWVLKLDAGGAIQWQQRYGGGNQDWANSIQQTTDGGYIVAGVANYGVNTDAWVLKLDASGAIQWQKIYGGTYDDRANSVQQTTDGGYIMAGHMNSLTGQHPWLLKLDAGGAIQWQKTYDDPNSAYSVQQTTDGGYIVAGYTATRGGDAWVVKLDSAGAIQWQHYYGEGTYSENAYSVQQTTDGGYIVAGRTFSPGVGGTWVLKLDGAGTIEWRYRYGGTGSDEAYSVQQTADGGYIVAGRTTSFGYISDAWVLKLDNLGNISDCAAQGTSTATAFSMSITETGTTSAGVIPAFTASTTVATSQPTTAYEPLVCPVPAPATFTLIYTAGAGGTIGGTSPQTVSHGGSGTAVTAMPNTGYHFTGWSDGALTASRADTNVTADISVTATFTLNTFTLIYTAGAGGTISGSTPQTVDYGTNGTAVTALPNTGHHFTGWSDGVLTASRTDTNVTADLGVTASFAPNTHTLTVATTGTGSGTVSGDGVYDYGTVVALTAIPATGSTFTGWWGGADGSDPDCADGSVTMTADKICIATFTLTQYTLALATTGTGAGTVGGGGVYDYNTVVPLLAIPADGSGFRGWSGAPDCADGLVTLATDTSCTATFDALAVADPDSPVQTTTVRQIFENGCAYFVEVNVETNSFVGMTPDPTTPFETVYTGTPKSCEVTMAPEICEIETGLAFCSVVRPGQPPLQSELGGTCYYPRNIKFTC